MENVAERGEHGVQRQMRRGLQEGGKEGKKDV